MAFYAVMEKVGWWKVFQTKADKVRKGEEIVLLGHKELTEDDVSFREKITIKDNNTGQSITLYKLLDRK